LHPYNFQKTLYPYNNPKKTLVHHYSSNNNHNNHHNNHHNNLVFLLFEGFCFQVFEVSLFEISTNI
jgi:hypothetical protein